MGHFTTFISERKVTVNYTNLNGRCESSNTSPTCKHTIGSCSFEEAGWCRGGEGVVRKRGASQRIAAGPATLIYSTDLPMK